MTAESQARSALVVAPHPDDETIGCGGTIRLKSRVGCAVTVVIAADGADEERRSECLEACLRLGVPKESVQFLGLPDGHLSDHRATLTAQLEDLIRDHRPAEVFGPSVRDNHPDHRVLAAALRDACDTLTTATLYEYPVWFWNRYAWVERGTPVWRQRIQLVWRPLAFTITTRVRKVDITSVVSDKRGALAAHVSQVGDGIASTDREVLDPEWLETFFGRDEIFFLTRRPHTRGRH